MDFDAGFVDTDVGEISVPAPVKAAMAGKFMSPEEAARLLGVSVDEVNRLVDRKKLFPMRDGATNKFKTDDVERLLRTLGEESGSGSGSGELDLDLPELVLDNAPAGGPGEAIDDDQLILDDGADSIFATPTAKGSSASDTGVGKGSVASKSNSGLSLSSPDLSLSSPGGLSGADLILGDSVLGDDLESDDLAIESIVGLVCCSLLLLFGGFIAYDLVRTIGSPESTTLSNPLLNSLAEIFGWR